MKQRILKIMLAILVSGSILFLLLRNVEPAEFWALAKTLNPAYSVLIVLGYVCLYLSRTLRFSLIVKKELLKIFFISTIHNFLNKLLPFRSGELSWPLLLKKYLGVGIADGIGLLLLIRYLDIFAIIVLFTTSAFLIQPAFLSRPLVLTLGAIVLAQVLSLVFLPRFIGIAARLLARVRITFLQAKVRALHSKLEELERKLNTLEHARLFAWLIPLSFLNWLSIYLIYYAYILMFHLEFSFLHVVVACSVVTLFTNLPINGIGRFGTFELGWAAGFMLLGMTKDVAVPLGLFVNLGNTLISLFLAVLGYVFLIWLSSEKV